MAIREIATWYENTNDATKYLLKSAGLYAAISATGNITAILTGSPTLDTIIDMTAPVITGAYLNNGLDRSNISEGARNAAHILIPGLIGADITNELLNYSGPDSLLEQIL